MKVTREQYEAMKARGMIDEPKAKRVNRFVHYTAQVPMPPSVNHLYATVRGRRVLTKEGRKYKKLVSEMFEHLGGDTMPVWFRLIIELRLPLYFKNGKVRKFDASNRVKVLEDAVCEGMGIDDSRVIQLVVTKQHACVESACVVIEAF